MTTQTCSPHNWQTPQPGDRALFCVDCERLMCLHCEITPNIRASILNSIEKRRGHDEAKAFRLIFIAAFENECADLKPCALKRSRTIGPGDGQVRSSSIVNNQPIARLPKRRRRTAITDEMLDRLEDQIQDPSD